MLSNGTLQEVMWKRIGKVFKEVEQREPWIGGQHIKSVALYYSENSRLWYGRENPQERYDNNFFGWGRTMMEEHIPFVPIYTLTEESLNGFQVLVLPNTACLSKAEAECIKEFVKNGGGLVCTQRTSLYDEDGNFLSNYRLADVLGIDYYGDTSTYERVYSRYDTNCAIAKKLPEDGLMSSWGTVQKVILREGATAVAKIVYPYTKATGKSFVNIMVNPPAIETDYPACVQNTYGKGKVIYFPSSIDSTYLLVSYPELKWLMADAIRYVSQDPLLVVLEAPSCVEMTAYEREEAKQLVIHLVNYQPENGRTIAYGKVETRHIIQETLPVYNLRLKVKVDKEIESIKLQPENTEVSYETMDGYVSITIPELKNHGMVVLDYK
jgi:hypothetical protein